MAVLAPNMPPIQSLADEAEGTSPFIVPASLSPEVFAGVRRRAVLECCKWDPQVGDTSTLAAFPLVIRAALWRQLARWAEQLDAEALAAEEELIQHSALHKTLAIPRRVRKALAEIPRLGAAASAARVMRFDFHWTSEDWRISEVNADVPGGFSESSAFTAMMALHYPETLPAGDPAARLVEAITSRTHDGGVIALLSAPGYMEDFQIVSYVAGRLAVRGFETIRASPLQLRWHHGVAQLGAKSVDAIFRFYQGEWMSRLPRSSGWQHFFRGGRTPVTNPGSAVLIESKRFPLVWDKLSTELPTWRALLPETREPRDVPWRSDDGWVLKSAMSNNGDAVGMRGWIDGKAWRSMRRSAFWRPGQWAAQRRFDALPVETPDGPAYPCLGVYTINGRAAGIYGRIAPQPLIDFAAVDVAVLVQREEQTNG